MTGFFNEVKAKLRYFARFTLLHPPHLFTINNSKPLHFLYQRPNGLELHISLIKGKRRVGEKAFNPSIAEGCFPHLLLIGPNSLCLFNSHHTVSCMTVPVSPKQCQP